MADPRKEIRILAKGARRLGRILDRQFPGGEVSLGRSYASSRGGADVGSVLPFDFLVEQFLVMLGELDELLACTRALWPDIEGWIANVAEGCRVDVLLPRWARAVGRDKVAGALFGVMPRHDFVNDRPSASTIDEAFERFLAVRRQVLALASTMPGRAALVLADGPMNPGWDHFLDMFERLEREDKVLLTIHLRDYLTNSWIFPWVNYSGQTAAERYATIFELTRRGEMDLERRLRDDLEHALQDFDFGADLTETIAAMLVRLSVVAQDGADVVRKAVFEGHRQSGVGSMLGIHAPINLIPGEGTGDCCEIALALAQGTSGKFGFGTVMRRVRAHLIHCFGTTRVVVLLTDTWDKKLVSESRLDIAAHHARRCAIVPVLVNGGMLKVLSWP